MITAGIDEAGRGPVIGPMVMAVCAIDEKNLHLLDEMGVKDSKLLTREQREELFSKIKAICKHNIIILSPQEIDDAVKDKCVNLNRLEGKTTAALINSVKSDKYIVDCPSTNISAYTEFLKTMTRKDANIICEHKADLHHKIAGAASILAKVTRDREIDKLQIIAKTDFGSGYPSDPKTQEFIKKNWNKYDFFRKTCSTYKCIADAQKIKQQKLADF